MSADSPYVQLCQLAVKDEGVFANFRSHESFRRIVETVDGELARRYLEQLHSAGSRLSDRLLQLAATDRVGDPLLIHDGRIGDVSALSLRYASVVLQLDEMFQLSSIRRIVEIGGGFGGLCRLAMGVSDLESYTIFDLPEVLPLVDKYLRKNGVDMERVSLRTIEEADRPIASDLLISNYAYSELRRDVQAQYLHNVLKHAQHGYMMYNHISTKSLRSFTAMETAEQLGHHVRYFRERPLTHRLNVGLAW